MDKASSYRIEALKAITAAANRSDAAFVARTLVRDDDFNVRFAAYEQLLKLDDVTISQTVIAGNFYLEQVAQANRKEIYVSRSGRPRIVLFDAPIYIVTAVNRSIEEHYPRLFDTKGAQPTAGRKT